MAAMTPKAAADEATRVVADARELDDSLATVAVAMKDCRDARVALYRSESRLASALKSLKNERTRINELAASLDGINNDDRELIAAASDRAKATHTEATAMLPTFGSFFVYLFIGPFNVRVSNRDERLKFKEGYEKFKMQGHIFAIIWTVAAAYLDLSWMRTILHAGLLYYYATLALRENILRANGSNIRRWWVLHHYLSIVMGGVMLTWPPSESLTFFRPYFLALVVYFGLAQIVQNRYQTRRLQILRDLGVKGELEVASETVNFYVIPLIPIVFIGHFYELYCSFILLRLGIQTNPGWHVFIQSVLFAVLGVGNLYTTVVTLRKKFLRARAAKQTGEDSGRTSPAADHKGAKKN